MPKLKLDRVVTTGSGMSYLTRVCETCEVEQPVENFRVIPRTGTIRRRRQCEECYTAKKTPYRRNRHLSQYDLDQQAYEELLQAQKHACAICKTHVSHLKRILQVDHNHRTRRVRGLLCNSCNGLLGLAHDDIARLLAAVDYLKENS